MTGHIGERRNREVALVTDDFRLYHRIAPFFERRGIHVLGLSPGEAVPASVRVVLGGPTDDPRRVEVRDDVEATWLAVLAALDDRPRLQEGPRHVVVGIDPGRTVGLAVVVEGLVYHVAEADGPAEAVERIGRWREGLEAPHWSVHLGHDAPQERDEVRRLLEERQADMAVHLVHEGASTPGSARTLSRHTDAAVRIARRPPI